MQEPHQGAPCMLLNLITVGTFKWPKCHAVILGYHLLNFTEITIITSYNLSIVRHFARK